MCTRKLRDVSLLLAFALTAFGQPSYVFTRVVDNSTRRPDGEGVFNITTVTTPSFDGRWVVFRDNGNKDDGSLASIWSYDTTTGKLQCLVDLKTRVPGGVGTFYDFELLDSAPIVRRGTVIFVAHDGAIGQGIYSVPVAGGAVARVADYNTADPSGGVFTAFDMGGRQAGAFAFDGVTAAFNGQGSARTLGNYTAKPDGSGLVMASDNLHPFTGAGGTVVNFNAPAISGNNVVMAGAESAAQSQGYNGIYLGRVGGGGVLTELVNSNQALPGNSNTNFHTRFNAPVLGFDGTLVTFRADDSGAFYGLYWTDLLSHAINKIADVNSTLPGLGRLSGIADLGVSVSQGNVLFKASDATGQNGLYLWTNGEAVRVTGSADLLDGRPAQVLADPGPAALYGFGFAFNVNFASFGGPAIYVAKPAANSIAVSAVTNSASYAARSIAPGEIVTLFGTGIGPAALAGFSMDASNHIPAGLANTRILFNGIAAPLIYASDQFSAAIVPFELAGQTEAQVVVEYNGNSSAPFTMPVTNTAPGLFSIDQSGSGLGAVLNADGSVNSMANPAAPGSTIVLWLSGLGPTVPPLGSGSVTPREAPALSYPAAVTIGGQTAQWVYQGPAPLAIAGLYQINCVVPAGLGSGPQLVTVTADGQQSQPNLMVSVQ